jgi:transposase
MLEGLRSGAPWRDLPERYGAWQTVYDRFTRYRKDGTLDRILQALQRCLNAGGLLDWDLWCVDGTVVRASRAAAGAGQKGDLPSRPIMPWAALVAVSPASSMS